MELKIIIDITLTQEELAFLRKHFDNREKVLNPLFQIAVEIDSKPNYTISLIKKEILKVDNLGSSSLTNIGKKVMDLIDRDKRINEILN